MSKEIPLTFKGTRSHFFEDDRKEEVFLTFDTEWRGAPAHVVMSCDRYVGARHEQTDWRVYACEARANLSEHRYAQRDEREALGIGPSAELSATAKERLHAAARPLALAWLQSDDYRYSRIGAIRHAAYRALRDDKYRGIKTARNLANKYVREFGPSAQGEILRAADALEEAYRLMERLTT